MGIRKTLRVLMASHGLSANRLSRDLEGDPSPTTITRILHGKVTNPHRDTLLRLAEYFGLTIGQLTGAEKLPEEILRVGTRDEENGRYKRRAKGAYYTPRFALRQLPRELDFELWSQIPIRVGKETVAGLQREFDKLDLNSLNLDDEEAQLSLKLLCYLRLWFQRQAINRT